ncbi:DgyrCDS6791 [Dimorphilus gyrociliatus]|uniref:DgyrCDS6791 n=1 Tax=Dimorphilus gyrociliatus TaxID=2664684 RepID=A0A7I8VP31_9ANNE|nr:DgyrCDS6791 [Dimorphilus gyrociliatus]
MKFVILLQLIQVVFGNFPILTQIQWSTATSGNGYRSLEALFILPEGVIDTDLSIRWTYYEATKFYEKYYIFQDGVNNCTIKFFPSNTNGIHFLLNELTFDDEKLVNRNDKSVIERYFNMKIELLKTGKLQEFNIFPNFDCSFCEVTNIKKLIDWKIEPDNPLLIYEQSSSFTQLHNMSVYEDLSMNLHIEHHRSHIDENTKSHHRQRHTEFSDYSLRFYEQSYGNNLKTTYIYKHKDFDGARISMNLSESVVKTDREYVDGVYKYSLYPKKKVIKGVKSTILIEFKRYTNRYQRREKKVTSLFKRLRPYIGACSKVNSYYGTGSYINGENLLLYLNKPDCLACRVEHDYNEFVEISLFHNDLQLTDTTRTVSNGFETTLYQMFDNVTENDRGKYTCKVGTPVQRYGDYPTIMAHVFPVKPLTISMKSVYVDEKKTMYDCEYTGLKDPKGYGYEDFFTLSDEKTSEYFNWEIVEDNGPKKKIRITVDNRVFRESYWSFGCRVKEGPLATYALVDMNNKDFL